MTTPDDHLKTLDGLACVFERAVKNGHRAPNTTNAATLTLCEERDAAQRWGEGRQKEMIGELATDLVPREPECVIRFSTLPLQADQWTSDQAPPKANDVVTIAGRAD
jgi:hypothetical protein